MDAVRDQPYPEVLGFDSDVVELGSGFRRRGFWTRPCVSMNKNGIEISFGFGAWVREGR